jgi:EAL domain-containing protein (putative c-di-GMP-specific phosphodiesterase class I)/GGDEF domain-containing protein
MHAPDNLVLFDALPPEARAVPIAHAEPLEKLVDRLLLGETVFLVRAGAAVDSGWLTHERIETHLRRALKTPAPFQVWPLLEDTWAFAVKAVGEEDGSVDPLWIHALRQEIAEGLAAEWRAAHPDQLASEALPAEGESAPIAKGEKENASIPVLSIFETAEIPEPEGDVTLFSVAPIAQIPALDGIQENIAELNALLEILVNKQLHPQFQPIIRLRDGQVVGYEALIRGPKSALLRRSGAMFQAAHKAHMVSWFDLACQEQCFAQAAAQGIRHLLFINMDAEGLAYLEMHERSLAQCARDHGLSPASIVIEITERQTVEDFPRLIHYIERLREQGFRIALDDVGTGYNSLRAIADLRPDFIKIDKGLVRHIDAIGERRALVVAMVQYAHHIGTTVLAEGAETRAELGTLIDLGVAWCQGYVVGKPADDLRGVPRELREFMRQRTRQRSLALVGREVTLDGLVRSGSVVAPETALTEAARRFTKDPGLTSVVVVEEGYARGLVMRSQMEYVLDMVTSANAAALLPAETVAQWMQTNVLFAEAETPVIDLARQVATRSDISLDTDIIICRDNLFIGVLSTRTLIEAATALQVNQWRYASPLTGLPGRVALEQALQERMEARQPLAVIRADITGLAAFNRHYGLPCGDSVIEALAFLLQEASANCGQPNDFLAHLGGDDFVLLTGAESVMHVCRALVDGFESIRTQFYTAEHIRQGYIQTEERASQRQRLPLFTLAVAAQTNRRRTLSCCQRTLSYLEKLLELVKTQPESGYLVDREVRAR